MYLKINNTIIIILYAAFMDIEKVYNIFDWRVMLDVMKVYCVGGSVLNVVKGIYNGVKACFKVTYW